MPQARRARGERAIKKAREALARQVRGGEDPRATSQAGRKRGAANAEHHRRNREWKREHGGTHDRVWFLGEVAPKLDAFSLAEIAAARAYPSQPARAFGPERASRIRGIGRHSSAS